MDKCPQKVVYYTRNKAWKATKKESLRLCKSMYFYQCPLCGWWHLTHINPTVFKRKRRYLQAMAKMERA